MNTALFNAAIQAAIKIMHKGQRNRHFMLTVEQHENNVGQLAFRYQLCLSADTAIKQPKELNIKTDKDSRHSCV